MPKSQIKVELIDFMGSDLSVINAARVSFAKVKDEIDSSDEKLIKYLAKHDHWSPFAHTAVTLRVAAPVPIRTQCFKHKIGLVENEESRRYISSTPEIFIPEFREKPEGSIKQGSGGEHSGNHEWQKAYRYVTEQAIDLYEDLLRDGIAPEQARFVLPQGAIVNWVWTGNILAFANFVNKRSDSNAQQEIQQVAKAVDKVIRPLYPCSWSALVDN
jgi:thymidylate synthase (FAD)